LLGCHVYSGHSWDTKLKYAETENPERYEVTNEEFQEIHVAIRNSARKYGFWPDYGMSDKKSKVLLNNREPENTFKALHGSDGSFSIAVYIIPASTSNHYFIRIFIRDFTYNEETEFSNSLNKMLENLLIDKFGFTGVEFVRAKVFILND